ncbi:D-alanine--D-alanine ligase family protein [Sphingosinicella rhizophila]|uniref:Phosphoribosylglycinamide synthetase n=1 Tax=Sphingosinicella rhizophila TaxID=3050082 RepID=A0ABU3Q4F1_9SPHN|nr:phosphoribosylglycinamide synthetase [Sphingosinicella sp. GR2756]MDT9597934.1 phosphoribosylglycinamide synthetase [Sphingosinicella sp. GR2756]
MHILKISKADKNRLKVMFLAKHALGTGAPDPADGNHAIYHHEMRTTLEEIGFNVVAANRYEAIFERPDVDYVVILLNRGGFLNSEMLAPLLLTRHGIKFMGASPIIRGLGDDKHLMKLAAAHRGVPVTAWEIFRRGGRPVERPRFDWEQLVVKPNASSASWGVGAFDNWEDARGHAEHVLGEGHDVIVEPHFGSGDVVIPVVGADGPVILPAMRFRMPGQDDNFRSYEEKRALVEAPREILERIEDPVLAERLADYTGRMLPEVWPFDYGRFEYRHDAETGELKFMEVNLSCNLWSKKTVSGAARLLGVSHVELVETIIAHSMLRQGVIDRVDKISVEASQAA